MCKMLGYGEDALTLWVLKNRMSEILNHFKDESSPSDCLVFYRPSFGRSGGKDSAEFGEFDAILISKENIYLIESKWDNLSPFQNNRDIVKPLQILRHQVFSWYLTHWNKKYSDNWEKFIKEQGNDFHKNFKGRKETLVPSGSLLSKNLKFILNRSLEHCRKSGKSSIKNVLLFFYNNKRRSKVPTKISKEFELIDIDYNQEMTGNFIALE